MYLRLYYKYDPNLIENLFIKFDDNSTSKKSDRPENSISDVEESIDESLEGAESVAETSDFVTLADVERFKLSASNRASKGPLARLQSDAWSYTNSSIGTSGDSHDGDFFSEAETEAISDHLGKPKKVGPLIFCSVGTTVIEWAKSRNGSSRFAPT